MMKTDFLVLGAGIAGLSYALKVADFFPDKKVCVISKADVQEGNTRYAQGGIAAVLDPARDSFGSHLEDTLVAGGGLCEQEVVKMVVQEAPERIRDLLGWGVSFDSTADGNFHLGREGGHTRHRILHSKDSTGQTIQEALVRQARSYPNIELLGHYFALDFIVSAHEGENTCCGAYVMNIENGQVEPLYARLSLLASGGAGQVYANTTNPGVATGDGIAMAARAGAAIQNMEFVQFHPTALYEPGRSTGTAFLITEALRGFGAELRNGEGTAFMQQYDARGSLAPRDVVARAITREMHSTNAAHVYLDARHLDKESLQEHFPMIYKKCVSLGLDLVRDMIPVVPAAHYFCGGVKTDGWGRTSIKNLYASGECAYTGLHGANRLASNSLLEALVFSHRAYIDSLAAIETLRFNPVKGDLFYKEVFVSTPLESVERGREELQVLMDRYAGIIRNREALLKLRKRIMEMLTGFELQMKTLPRTVAVWELYNLLTVSRLVVEASLERRESIGLHYLEPDAVGHGHVYDHAFL